MRYTKICQICQRHWQNLSNIRCNSKFSTTCGKMFKHAEIVPQLVGQIKNEVCPQIDGEMFKALLK